MILFFKVIAILFILIPIWVCVKYCSLMTAKKEAFVAFDNIKKQIDSQYDFILTLFSKYENLMINEQQIITETKNLISEAKNFSLEKDGADKIIAFANAIFYNIEAVSQNYSNVSEEYKSSQANFNIFAEKYNADAKKLRYYVDVFPTSLICRFLNIKTLNYLY